MFNLLKMDLKRLFKDKLFLVLCILAGVFALITPLLYKGLFALMEGEDLLGMFSAKDLKSSWNSETAAMMKPRCLMKISLPHSNTVCPPQAVWVSALTEP